MTVTSIIARCLLLAGITVALASTAAAADSLDIYDIDAEGGAAILFVSPARQSVLIDTGFAGPRDAERIAEAAQAAGIAQIDYLIVTHYHGDHVGGFPELVKRLPVRHFVDHGPTVQPEQRGDSLRAYEAASAHDHIVVKAGDRLPVSGLEWTIVASAGKTITRPVAGASAGKRNPFCSDFESKDISVDLENAQSVGSVVRYGKFRAVELGDLLWNVEAQLACPTNEIGRVDVLLTTHHGSDWSGVPALIYGLHPQVAVMNNGLYKGGSAATFRTLEQSPGLQDLWQLHWSFNGGLEYNTPGRFIANVESAQSVAQLLAQPPAEGTRPTPIEHAPAYWIKLSALADGTFKVTNSRNGFTKTYTPGALL